MATNWPLGVADMRLAIEFKPDQGDDTELLLFITAACGRVDREVGRAVQPTRYEVGDKVPEDFILAARALAKLRWQQAKKGPRAQPEDGSEAVGFDLPRWIDGLLSKYPPPLFVAEDS